MTLAAADLNSKQFQKISDMVYRTAGINLKEGKEALVRARLMKRLRFLGMAGWRTISSSSTAIRGPARWRP